MTFTLKSIKIFIAFLLGMSLAISDFLEDKHKSTVVDNAKAFANIETKPIDIASKINPSLGIDENITTVVTSVNERKSITNSSIKRKNSFIKDINKSTLNYSQPEFLTVNLTAEILVKNILSEDSTLLEVEQSNLSSIGSDELLGDMTVTISPIEQVSIKNDILSDSFRNEDIYDPINHIQASSDTTMDVEITDSKLLDTMISSEDAEKNISGQNTNLSNPANQNDELEITENDVTEAVQIHVIEAIATNNIVAEIIDNELVTSNNVAEKSYEEKEVVGSFQSTIPDSERITLKVDIEQNAIIKISYIDQNGKLVNSSSIANLDKGIQKITLDTSVLNSGTYQIYVHDVSNKKTVKTLQYFKL